jgi:phosphoesterase RecJ-like protein
MLAEELSQARCRKVLIDHHHSPDKEHFDLIFSDYAISSTCELVLWLSYAMWDERFMNREVATCLYAGLNTDTGGFAFSCEQPSCFEAAAKLVKFDIHPAEIHNKIVNTFSVNRMQFYGFALNERLKIYPSQHVAIMVFSLDDQRRFGVGGEDMEGLVNYTLMMKEMEVGALLREEPGRTKVSLRAKYDVDVNMIARQLGGGGHTKAAGATCIMPLDKTLDAVEQLLGIKNVEPLIIGAER